MYLHGESGDADADGVAQAISQLPILLSNYEPEDVYNMDEIGLYFRAHPNKTLAQGRVKGRTLKNEIVTITLATNSNGTDKLKLLVIYTSKQPRCFGRWQPYEYLRWHSNKIAWMKGDIFEAWILQLNNQFKIQNQKMIMILDNASSHVVSFAKVGKFRGFSTFVTSKVQPLDQGIITSFKIPYKNFFVVGYITI